MVREQIIRRAAVMAGAVFASTFRGRNTHEGVVFDEIADGAIVNGFVIYPPVLSADELVERLVETVVEQRLHAAQFVGDVC